MIFSIGNPPASRSANRRSMTLVELLVVLGIIGLVVGMSVPGLIHYSTQLHLKVSTQQLIRLLLLARSTAISSHTDQAVVVDQEKREVRITNTASGESLEQIVHLPPSVTLELWSGEQPLSENQFVFRSTGSLIGRSVLLVLSDRQRQKTITITGATGAVLMSE